MSEIKRVNGVRTEKGKKKRKISERLRKNSKPGIFRGKEKKIQQQYNRCIVTREK